VRGEGPVEVTLEDGWRAVAMGVAAQSSATARIAVSDVFGAGAPTA